MTFIIECKDFHKTYNLGKVKISALRGVNLEIEAGSVVSIVGPSGSGKTTLLNIIGGIDSPDSGTVIVDGIDISRMPEKN